MEVLLPALLPAVPAVAPGELLVAPPAVAPAPAVEPLPGVVLLALDPLEDMRALVSVNPPVREVVDVAPAVPVVPVAPAVLPLPERQPVTVIVRLLLDV